jgi:hypothetical protein
MLIHITDNIKYKTKNVHLRTFIRFEKKEKETQIVNSFLHNNQYNASIIILPALIRRQRINNKKKKKTSRETITKKNGLLLHMVTKK